MIFVDSSAWYSLEVEDDTNHRAASSFLSQIASGKHGIAITTDYILDETLTLLQSRRGLGFSGFIQRKSQQKQEHSSILGK